MPDANADPLIVAISSRTLFDLEDSHVLFERDGLDAYAEFQRSREDDLLAVPALAVQEDAHAALAHSHSLLT